MAFDIEEPLGVSRLSRHNPGLPTRRGRVERSRGGLGAAYQFPALSSADGSGARPARSNRTGDMRAIGCDCRHATIRLYAGGAVIECQNADRNECPSSRSHRSTARPPSAATRRLDEGDEGRARKERFRASRPLATNHRPPETSSGRGVNEAIRTAAWGRRPTSRTRVTSRGA